MRNGEDAVGGDAAWRRRQRCVLAVHRCVRWTVNMEMATALHHSCRALQKMLEIGVQAGVPRFQEFELDPACPVSLSVFMEATKSDDEPMSTVKEEIMAALQGRIVEHRVNIPVAPFQEDVVAVVQLAPEELIQERFAEQNAKIPVPST